MNVKCAEIKYMQSNVSLYSTQLHKNSCNKINFTDIHLYFLLPQQLRDDIIKADCKVKVFIMF